MYGLRMWKMIILIEDNSLIRWDLGKLKPSKIVFAENLPGGGRLLWSTMAMNSCFDSIPQANHAWPWDRRFWTKAILGGRFSKLEQTKVSFWRQIKLQSFNSWFKTSEMHAGCKQYAINVQSVFSQLSVYHVSCCSVLRNSCSFPPGSKTEYHLMMIAMCSPWPRKVCEEGPKVGKHTHTVHVRLLIHRGYKHEYNGTTPKKSVISFCIVTKWQSHLMLSCQSAFDAVEINDSSGRVSGR